MTLAELRTRLDYHVQTDLDSFYGVTPSDANKTSLINESLRMIARFVKPHFKKVTLTVSTNDQRIALDSSKFARAMWNLDGNAWVSTSQAIPIVPYPRFDASTDWRFATSGTPVLATLDRDNILFDRPWSAGETLYVDGVGFYLALVNGTDVPELPVYAHEAIAYLAAIIAAEPSVTDGVALNRLQSYNATLYRTLNEVRTQMVHNELDLSNYGAPSL